MSSGKPWTSYEQQLQILLDRGLTIEDEDNALSLLKSVGYYRLSGYWKPMYELTSDGKETDVFHPEATFQSVIDIWDFDKRLKAVVWEAIESIEILLRTKIAHVIGNDNPLGHLDKNFLDGNFSKKLRVDWNKNTLSTTEHEEWVSKLDRQIKRSSNELFVKRYRKRGEQLPIWVAAELFDFGQTSFLYEGLKHNHKEKIAGSLNVDDPILLRDWMKSLNYLRNVIGHHSRLWNKNITQPPALPNVGIYPELDHLRILPALDWQKELGNKYDNRKRFYSLACIVLFLMERNCHSLDWKTSLTDVMDTFPSSPIQKINMNQMGFPTGWKQEKLWISPIPNTSAIAVPKNIKVELLSEQDIFEQNSFKEFDGLDEGAFV